MASRRTDLCDRRPIDRRPDADRARRRRRACRLSVTFGIAGLAVAGCGGHTATRADVIARADAICSSTLSSIRAVAPPTDTSAHTLGVYLRKVAPIVDKEAGEIAKLPRPAAHKATLDQFVAAVQSTDGVYRQAAAAAARGDSSGVARALSALGSGRAPALAKRYGITACAASTATVR